MHKKITMLGLLVSIFAHHNYSFADTFAVAITQAITFSQIPIIQQQKQGGWLMRLTAVPSNATANSTAPYSYSWSTGDTTCAITIIQAGTYTVTVTDANGNTGTAAVELENLATPTVLIKVTCSVICEGYPLQMAAHVLNDDQSPYTYAWTGPQGFTATTPTMEICNPTWSNQGVYSVTVTDSQGYMGTSNINIRFPDTTCGATGPAAPCGGGQDASPAHSVNNQSGPTGA